MKNKVYEKDVLSSKKVIKISSVGDYLNKLKKLEKEFYDSFEYDSLERYKEWIKKDGLFFYRGESDLYEKHDAALFRGKGYIPLSELLRTYEKEVADRISESERKVILAHGQHHGLSTNLLDITVNPLVALFFACSGNNTKNGFVYLFPKTETVALPTETVVNEGWNFNRIIKNNDVYQYLKRDIQSIYQKGIFQLGNEVFQQKYQILVEKLQSMSKEGLIGTEKQEVKDIAEKFSVMENYTINSILKIVKEAFGNSNFKEADMYLKLFEIYLDNFDKTDGEELIDTFNFIYDPIMPFNRAKVQQGCFIYQVSMLRYFDNKKDGNYFLVRDFQRQVVHSYDTIFKVPKKYKKEILEDLDSLNINMKTIYGDFDNIARYLNSKKTNEPAEGEVRVKHLRY